MKALVRVGNGPGEFALQELEEPRVLPGTVKLKVAYAGICGTDLHMYEGKMDLDVPVVLGHEFSGTIEEIGDGVDGFSLGEQVTAEHTFHVCGSCEYCRDGRYQLCEKRVSVGFEEQGAFAQYVLVSPDYIHRLPEGVSLREGAMTEPLACAVHGVELVNPQAGTRSLVVGPGPIGILTGLVLKAYGCRVDIVGTPQDARRLEAAAGMGLSVVTPEDLELSRGYDLVADCSGAAGGINAALQAVKKGGEILQVGIAGKPVTIDYDTVLFKELRVQGTFTHVYSSWERSLRLEKEGLVDVKGLLGDDRSLDDWHDAFETLRRQEAMKILFRF